MVLSTDMSKDLLYVGSVLSPHGLKGAFSIYSDTRPASGIAGYSFWFIGESPDTAKSYTVERCWQHGKGMLVHLEHVNTLELAMSLKKQNIYVSRDEMLVEDDEYLWEDLLGCHVYAGDVLLGKVSALEAYGAQDILCVKSVPDMAQQGDWMIPFIEDTIIALNLDDKRIDIQLIDGMDACFTPKS
ncbi:MAG: ribosome maturation factor RimM [Mariprofundaceae bacterium]|nr:ribosome maturation factor RimM [Mariprofundaceae bacterium]